MLVRATQTMAHALGDVSYGYPNRLAAPVFLRAGYRVLGSLTRHALVLRHRRFMDERLARTPALRAPAAVALDAARAALVSARALAAARRYRLTWPEDVDERFDRLWHAAGPAFLVGQRDAAFLRWRFLHHPGQRYALAALHQKDGDAIRPTPPSSGRTASLTSAICSGARPRSTRWWRCWWRPCTATAQPACR